MPLDVSLTVQKYTVRLANRQCVEIPNYFAPGEEADFATVGVVSTVSSRGLSSYDVPNKIEQWGTGVPLLDLAVGVAVLLERNVLFV